jgi:trans-aconitate methyltransferase
MSSGQKTTALRTYLELLDKEQFSHFLNEVLTEMHKREFEQVKKDVLTYSMSRRVGKLGA